MSANVYGGRRNNNLNVNNARQMTPAAARATMRSTHLSTLVSKGRRGIVIFYILLITSLLPTVEGYIPTQTLETLKERRNTSAPLLTNAQKSAAKQGAILTASYFGGTTAAAGVLLAQIRADPMVQLAILLTGISIFVYKYLNMRMNRNRMQHEARESAAQRAHQERLFQMMIEQQQAMIPNIVMAVMQGRDPTLAQLAGNQRPLLANRNNRNN